MIIFEEKNQIYIFWPSKGYVGACISEFRDIYLSKDFSFLFHQIELILSEIYLWSKGFPLMYNTLDLEASIRVKIVFKVTATNAPHPV